MSLRNNLQKTATKLIAANGDPVYLLAITKVDGATEFDPPTFTTERTRIDAIVTGASSWADGENILMTDLRVLVSGAFPLAAVGDKMEIEGNQYTIEVVDPKLAIGVKSAVIYFVRR